MKVICIDTETTGLPKKRNASITDDANWPYAVQISWMILEDDKIVKTRDFIININGSIPEESTAIHGITNEIMNEKGVSIHGVLEELCNDCKEVQLMVAHNLEFDKKIIMVELYRNGFYQEYNDLRYSKFIEVCTMKAGKDLCKIEKKDRFGNMYYKWPQLSELYEKLFQTTPQNLHNSLVDMCACLRCFYKMRFGQDIIETNAAFKDLFTQNMTHIQVRS